MRAKDREEEAIFLYISYSPIKIEEMLKSEE